MSQYCNSCGSQYRQNAPSCACGSHQSSGYNHGQAPYYPHSHPNYCPTKSTCEPVIQGVTGRSINDGLWRVLDDCGKPVPYAWTEVLYSGTTQKAPVGWKRDMKPEHLYPMNPVQADHNGVVRLFYKGGPVDIVFYNNCNGAPGDVIGRITDVGGFEEGDFPLDARPVNDCIDIDNPLLSIYDKDNCKRPAFLATPLAVHIAAMIKAELPTAKFSDVKEYFKCLGEDWPDGVIVYGDCSECPELYIYKGSCPEECPPDPCSVDFDDDGQSPCWDKCQLSICEQVTTQANIDATYALDCDPTNGLVRRPITPAASVTLLDSPVLIQQETVQADFDTGVVTVNLNNLPGVTVPEGATGVILKTHASTDGDEVLPSGYSEAGLIAVEGSLPVGPFNKLGLNTAVYTDSNLGKSDNDNDNQLMVRAPTLPNLRYQMQHDFGGAGNSQAYYQIALVGFV